MKKLIIAILILTLFNACEKANEGIIMSYQMTQCADPWMGTDYSVNKEVTLEKFLTEKGIKVISLSITTDCGTSSVCQACTCKGCDSAEVKVSADDVEKMEALKFVKVLKR